MKIGLHELAINAAKAAGQTVIRMVNGEDIIIESDEQHKRLMICGECNHFTGKSCGKCGCNMKIKTKLTGSKCPVGKWQLHICELMLTYGKEVQIWFCQ